MAKSAGGAVAAQELTVEHEIAPAELAAYEASLQGPQREAFSKMDSELQIAAAQSMADGRVVNSGDLAVRWRLGRRAKKVLADRKYGEGNLRLLATVLMGSPGKVDTLYQYAQFYDAFPKPGILLKLINTVMTGGDYIRWTHLRLLMPFHRKNPEKFQKLLTMVFETGMNSRDLDKHLKGSGQGKGTIVLQKTPQGVVSHLRSAMQKVLVTQESWESQIAPLLHSETYDESQQELYGSFEDALQKLQALRTFANSAYEELSAYMATLDAPQDEDAETGEAEEGGDVLADSAYAESPTPAAAPAAGGPSPATELAALTEGANRVSRATSVPARKDVPAGAFNFSVDDDEEDEEYDDSESDEDSEDADPESESEDSPSSTAADNTPSDLKGNRVDSPKKATKKAVKKAVKKVAKAAPKKVVKKAATKKVAKKAAKAPTPKASRPSGRPMPAE